MTKAATFITCILFFSAAFFASAQASYSRSEWPHATHGDDSVTSIDRSDGLSPVHVGPQDGLKEADKITALLGQPAGFNFSQYAGYVTVDPKNGRALFYYFAESSANPTEKPLVLWLNGGPGCSSLGYGAMQELGPFRVNREGKLYENEYAWTKAANIIFLESPVGVGFSYSNPSSDSQTNGDKRTALDSLTFLVNWLERYPEYKNRDFYMAGESYAGYFIPQLAKLILLRNNNTDKPINLKGIAIGNAYLDRTGLNTKESYEFLWSHAMYSDETHALILKNCDFFSMTSPECKKALDQAKSEVGRIKFYNIYASVCNMNHTALPNEYDPCADDYVSAYLNNPSVQNALHAIPRNWSGCRTGMANNWSDSEPTMLYTMKHLITSGIRVWLYSGDMDAVVPVTSTKSFIRLLELPIESPWRPWYNIAEVGGYVVAYKGLTFVTVRGAGHDVPSYQGERALHMISSFLQGNLP